MTAKDLRAALWQNGYRPVAIPYGKKFPVDKDWTGNARLDPPICIQYANYGYTDDAGRFQRPSHRPNTGILTDGLRPADIDIHDESSLDVLDWCLDHLGPAPVRYRDNSHKLLALYAAADGEPSKTAIMNRKDLFDDDGRNILFGVEILGRGNQFLAYGNHPSGASLKWLDDKGPHNIKRADLTKITERQVEDLKRFVAPLINVEYEPVAERITRPAYVRSGVTDDGDVPLAVLERAFHFIPSSDDRKDWLDFGFACYEANPREGGIAWDEWSRQSSRYNAANQKATWDGLQPHTGGITRGTIFKAAKETNCDWWKDYGPVEDWWKARAASYNGEPFVDFAQPIERIKSRLEWNKKRNQAIVTEEYQTQAIEAIRRMVK